MQRKKQTVRYEPPSIEFMLEHRNDYTLWQANPTLFHFQQCTFDTIERLEPSLYSNIANEYYECSYALLTELSKGRVCLSHLELYSALPDRKKKRIFLKLAPKLLSPMPLLPKEREETAGQFFCKKAPTQGRLLEYYYGKHLTLFSLSIPFSLIDDLFSCASPGTDGGVALRFYDTPWATLSALSELELKGFIEAQKPVLQAAFVDAPRLEIAFDPAQIDPEEIIAAAQQATQKMNKNLDVIK